MPKLIDPNHRETVILHAPWWSAATIPGSRPCLVLERRKRLKSDPDLTADTPLPDADDDDEFEWFYTEWAETPVERAELYRHVSHEDAKWVNAKINNYIKLTQGGGSKMDGAALSRGRTLGYLRRVVRMTDDKGEAMPITEGTFDRLPESETSYLDAAIKVLDDPVAPVTPAHRAKAAAAQDAAERGFPVRAEDVNAEAVAAHALFRRDGADL